jgi:hypothetical protein
MRFIKFYGLLLMVALVACSPLKTYIKTDTTVFYKESFESKGSIVVLPGDISLKNSLEFDLYQQKVQEKLMALGFSRADSLETADYAALLLYAVDDGKQSVVYTPIYGQTGRRISSYSGIAYDEKGRAVYLHRNYLSPNFGVVGASADTKTNYRQTIALDIVKANSLIGDEPVKLFEGRTFSSGACSVIVEVFDELLEAMFIDFPGENGRNRSQTIESITNCP